MSVQSPRTSTSSADLTGAAKLEDVTRLMNILTNDLQEITLLPHQRDAHLEAVKVYSRDPTNAGPIYTKEGIETLSRHAFNSPSLSTSRNALRCLANTLLLEAELRQVFLDLGYEQKACNKLKNDSRDDEFLVSRIIFLTTYNPNLNIERLIDQYHLAENICVNLGRHAKRHGKPWKPKDIDPMEDMALTETAKLMFNLIYHCPQRASSFASAVQPLLVLITNRQISSTNPLEQPVGSLVNVLLNIDLEPKETVALLFPKATPGINANRLIDILQKSVIAYTDQELEHNLPPLLNAIRKVFEVAPKDAQLVMQKALLPSVEDRKQVLGRGDTLPSRLLRLSTNPTTPAVRESVSQLLFVLSGKDARNFVQNVGYGFASGFLFQHNVPVPENALEAWSTNESGGSNAQDTDNRVNPITGQYLENEEKIEAPEMTQEEKEREAEKLFVLFERLKKTGVMSVKNPVETAVQQGRFEELDDDAESE